MATLDRGLLLNAASVVAARLRAQCIRDADGSVSWVGNARETAEGSGNPKLPLPDGIHDFYSGLPGIGLFFAAHGRLTGDAESRELALRIFAPLRQQARAVAAGSLAHSLARLGIGGLVGAGSLLYCFVKLGQLLDDASLLDEAHALSALITPEELTADIRLDVVYGCAGAILTLLSLGRVADRPNPRGQTPLELAQVARGHLLRHRISFEQGPRAWARRTFSWPRSGMAHGTTGVCMALARLANRVGGDTESWDAIAEALRFERQLFDPQSGNWFLSPERERKFLLGWCHGAPGMALGRIALLDLAPPATLDASLREELGWALTTLRTSPPYAMDHLCCGNMGWAETLLRAWQHTEENVLLQKAHAIALHVLRAAKTRGGFHLGPGNDREPSFFHGLAGLGYGFLRLAEPSTLPCLALFE
ncbi:hypothetical protein G4177_15130 [Corallococcus sp. ZKHCc1 1396]|uniref:Lanthionine synthetase n=1 Tax=Corallococcus soli TaxID=2710757 RepID=A0ABR9PNP9_9BACT|nr:hypothetical protein [Corallococcus soli]